MVIKAIEWGPRCLQYNGEGEEDCLKLNVFVPQPLAARLPQTYQNPDERLAVRACIHLIQSIRIPTLESPLPYIYIYICIQMHRIRSCFPSLSTSTGAVSWRAGPRASRCGMWRGRTLWALAGGRRSWSRSTIGSVITCGFLGLLLDSVLIRHLNNIYRDARVPGP